MINNWLHDTDESRDLCDLCGKMTHTDKVPADQCEFKAAKLGQDWGM